MRLSKSFLKTYKEVPAVAETVSHQLMLRAGMIKQLTRGVYSYLPIAYRTIRKIENIIREEMNNAGAQEVLMPVIQPSDLWIESGRYFAYGKELMRLKDRNDRDFVLGPTHEEVVVDIVRNMINSYKDLPLNLYQIQTKFRDELRPRFGLMRGREFIMKDAYSFHLNYEDLDREYQNMKQAYINIFNRCGVVFRPVEADTGSIGGAESHEFMVLADSGEDDIVYSTTGEYAANIEKAVSKIDVNYPTETLKEKEKIHTPNTKTIEEVSNFLNIDSKKVIKTILYKEVLEKETKYYIVLIRGDLEINDIKVKNTVNASVELELLNDEDLKALNIEKGFIGALKDYQNIEKILVIADDSIKNLQNFVVGANEKDYHYINTNIQDLKIDKYADIRMVKAGDKCIYDDSTLEIARGIEVGHIFKLGTKYSEALNLKVLDNNGRQQTVVMGCYGIGVSRVMAATVEQNYDENGIIWPLSIAPYHIIVVPVNIKNELQRQKAEEIYQTLLSQGMEVILDDRNEKAGFKFKDADLIGIPYRIVIGKDVENNEVEFITRKGNISEKISIQEAVNKLQNILKN